VEPVGVAVLDHRQGPPVEPEVLAQERAGAVVLGDPVAVESLQVIAMRGLVNDVILFVLFYLSQRRVPGYSIHN
jgi:hypothetical protein